VRVSARPVPEAPAVTDVTNLTGWPPPTASGKAFASLLPELVPPSGRSHCPNERVEGGRFTRVGDHCARDPLRPLDLKARKVLHDLLRAEQDCRVLWPTGSVQAVGGVMADHEQGPTGREGGCGMREHLAALLGGKVQVHHNHDVERGWRSLPLDDIGLDPGHFHATVGRQSPCLGQPGTREVDAGHTPTLRGEPHRVTPLATGKVERPTRNECVQLLDEKAVRVGISSSVPYLSSQSSRFTRPSRPGS